VRILKRYRLSNPETFKNRLLLWAQKYEEVVWLDTNGHHKTYGSYDAVLAVDAFTSIKTDDDAAFDRLKEYQASTEDWIFGYLSYDLKNSIEQLHSNQPDELGFPDLYFFQPKKIFFIRGNELELHYIKMVDDQMDLDYKSIASISAATIASMNAYDQQKDDPCGKV